MVPLQLHAAFKNVLASEGRGWSPPRLFTSSDPFLLLLFVLFLPELVGVGGKAHPCAQLSVALRHLCLRAQLVCLSSHLLAVLFLA